MDRKDTRVVHGFVVEYAAAPYSLDAHRYRITRTLHLRTWIVNYERSCPRMTYITSGLQERASASSWRCSSAPLCPLVEGNGERVVKKGSTVTTSFARQNSRGPRLGYDMKAVRKKERDRKTNSSNSWKTRLIQTQGWKKYFVVHVVLIICDSTVFELLIYV